MANHIGGVTQKRQAPANPGGGRKTFLGVKVSTSCSKLILAQKIDGACPSQQGLNTDAAHFSRPRAIDDWSITPLLVVIATSAE